MGFEWAHVAVKLRGFGVGSRAHDFVPHERLVIFHPGIVARRNGIGVAGVDCGACPVFQLNGQGACRAESQMVALAAVRMDYRLDCFGPPPAGLEGKPAQSGVANIDDVYLGLGRPALLIRFVKGL